MKIVLGISTRNDEILQIKSTLEKLGHVVRIINLNSYRQDCSYIMKKIDKLGFHLARARYNKRRYNNLLKLLNDWKPECILFIDLAKGVFTYDELLNIKKMARFIKSKFFSWIVDPLHRTTEEISICKIFDKVYSYEKDDVVWLQQQGCIASFVPVGYGNAYQKERIQRKSVFDILFVGTPYPIRLRLLECIAEKADINDWHLGVFGPFFERRYPWKKLLFKEKYPHLFKYIVNGNFLPIEISTLYNSARICLNIHGNGATGCNPRTYEILGSGGFELMDVRADYDILEPDKDIVVFYNEEDLLEKLMYYLTHEEERNNIADAGHKKVLEKRSMKNSLETIFLDQKKENNL